MGPGLKLQIKQRRANVHQKYFSQRVNERNGQGCCTHFPVLCAYMNACTGSSWVWWFRLPFCFPTGSSMRCFYLYQIKIDLSVWTFVNDKLTCLHQLMHSKLLCNATSNAPHTVYLEINQLLHTKYWNSYHVISKPSKSNWQILNPPLIIL